MIEVRQTELFVKWHKSLKDRKAAVSIAKRILRIQGGLLGDVKSVGGGVSELRIHLAAGYRLYFVRRGSVLVVLLCGGDKDSQDADIRKAKELAKTV